MIEQHAKELAEVGIGGNMTTTNVEKPLPVLRKRIMSCCETISQQQHLILNVSNRLFGDRPETPVVAAERPEPNGHYAELLGSVIDLEGLCEDLREAVAYLQENA